MVTFLLLAISAALGFLILTREAARRLVAALNLSQLQQPAIRFGGRYGVSGCRGECRQRIARRRQVMTSRSRVAHTVSTPEAVSQVAPMAEEGRKKAPTPEEIRLRAFEIYIQRGGIDGCDLDDWLQAERELQELYKNNAGTSNSSVRAA